MIAVTHLARIEAVNTNIFYLRIFPMESQQITTIAMDKIRAGLQPRKTFADIETLSQSIKDNGLLQPITVRPLGNGLYQIVAGERRFRSCQQLGHSVINAIVKNISESDAFKFAVIENMQRADLSPLEEAMGFKELQDRGLKQKEIGKIIGKGQSYIADKLRILSLSESILEAWGSKKISDGHLKQLLKLPDSQEQEHFYNEIISREMSVKEIKKEIDQRIEQIKANNQIADYTMSIFDDQRLKAVGVNDPYSDVWYPEHFKLCESQMAGVISLLIKMTEQALDNKDEDHIKKVSLVDFTPEQLISMEKAVCKKMGRTISNAEDADLIFIKGNGIENTISIVSKARPNQIIFHITGNEEISYDYDGDLLIMWREYDVLQNINFGKSIILSLKERDEPLTDKEIERLSKHPLHKQSFIMTIRRITPLFISHEMFLKWQSMWITPEELELRQEKFAA